MIRDERGEAWVTVRAAIIEGILLVLCAAIFIALCAVSQ